MKPSAGEQRRGIRLPFLAVPLGFYLAMTIGVPFLNGAATGSGFWEHAATTLAVTGGLSAVLLGVGCFLRRAPFPRG